VAAVPSHLSRKVCERAERLLEGSLRKVVFNAAIKAYWLRIPHLSAAGLPQGDIVADAQRIPSAVR
jgi:hypothetical protein